MGLVFVCVVVSVETGLRFVLCGLSCLILLGCWDRALFVDCVWRFRVLCLVFGVGDFFADMMCGSGFVKFRDQCLCVFVVSHVCALVFR